MKAVKKDICFTLECVGVHILVLWHLIPYVYRMIDDRYMSEIVSGQYMGMTYEQHMFVGCWYDACCAGRL